MKTINNNIVECMQVCEHSKFIEKILWYYLKRKILIDNEIGNVIGYVKEVRKIECGFCFGKGKVKSKKLGPTKIIDCPKCNGKGYQEYVHDRIVYDVNGVHFRYSIKEVDPTIKFIGEVEHEEEIDSNPDFTYKCLFTLMIYFDENLFNKVINSKLILREKFNRMKDEIFMLLKETKEAA